MFAKNDACLFVISVDGAVVALARNFLVLELFIGFYDCFVGQIFLAAIGHGTEAPAIFGLEVKGTVGVRDDPYLEYLVRVALGAMESDGRESLAHGVFRLVLRGDLIRYANAAELL